MYKTVSSSTFHRVICKSASPVAATSFAWWIRREQSVLMSSKAATAFSQQHQHRYVTSWRSCDSGNMPLKMTSSKWQSLLRPRWFSEKPKTSPASGADPAKRGFLQWYEGHLQARPVATKMVTGSLLWGIGDAVAQLVPQMMVTVAPTSPDNSNDDDKKKKIDQFKYDWPRTGRATLFGFAIHAPTSHVHFNFLEWLTHRAGVTGLGIPFFKAFMEQFVYWSWLSNSLYHGAMGAMQGMTPQQIYDRIADVLWETQKAQWVFWIPVQLLNFQFVPVRHQLNVVLLTSIVWTALLSMWYPPQEEGEEIAQSSEQKKQSKLLRRTTSMSTTERSAAS